jgi:hypothetical protein
MKTMLAVATTASWRLTAPKVTGTGTTMAVLEVLKCDVLRKRKRPGSLGRELQVRTFPLQPLSSDICYPRYLF